MNRKIDLGTFVATERPFLADLDVILRSNVLVQANSGGGKSWLLRRMIEQTFGKVPQIVVDPEGEFSTLRERFDFVLVGQGGDTPADVRSAPLLAERLLELGASAVVDLYEMPKQLRPAWVAAFVNALVDAPKKLWRNLLVYVDEAHEMAPEPGHGASESPAEKACRRTLIDLGAKGRKRGYGCVAATQRLGKLSKDFAAELKNTLIGQTWIDIDRERAAGSLGIGKTDRASFFRDAKTIAPGNFFVLGRAFALEPLRVRIGDVQTEHPQAGIRQSAPPPPTDKIRHLLPQLADLPREAEQKIQTESELRAEVARLRREQATRPAAPPEHKIEVPVVPAEWVAKVKETAELLGTLHHRVNDALRLLGQQFAVAGGHIGQLVDLGTKHKPDGVRFKPKAPPAPRSRDVQESGDSSVGNGGLRRMLVALAQRPRGLTNAQLGVRAGMSAKSGTFATYLARVRTMGWVGDDGQLRCITDAGIAALGDFEPLPVGRDLAEHWIRELGGGASRMLHALVDAYPSSLTSTELGERAEISPSSGTFATYLARLRSLELVTGRGGGDLRASEELA
jgi:hypothetical protein